MKMDVSLLESIKRWYGLQYDDWLNFISTVRGRVEAIDCSVETSKSEERSSVEWISWMKIETIYLQWCPIFVRYGFIF